MLRAPWKKIVCTPVDISIKTRLTPAMIKQIEASGTPLARYVARFYQTGQGGEYMWDELAAAAWIDPSLITKTRDSLHGRRSRPRRGIWQHADLDREGQAEDCGAAG